MKPAFILIIFLLTGCNIKASKLYIFKLNHQPNRTDWENALSYDITVEKGKLNQPKTKSEKLDKETIHSSNKTCHHENSSKPVTITLSAFWTDENVFLRIKWPDPVKDDVPAVWDSRKKTWDKSKGAEDGLGISWYNCKLTCHISDWEVKNAMLNPMCRMKTKNGETQNLLVWWAGRFKPDNSAWNVTMDSLGIHEENILRKISAESYYENGSWTVTLKYPMADFENKNPVQFQIAIFNNTYFDHSITSKIQKAVFVKFIENELNKKQYNNVSQ